MNTAGAYVRGHGEGEEVGLLFAIAYLRGKATMRSGDVAAVLEECAAELDEYRLRQMIRDADEG